MAEVKKYVIENFTNSKSQYSFVSTRMMSGESSEKGKVSDMGFSETL
jgi:hypothetical protein